MNILNEWIEKDLEAELERLDEASQQVRKQRNLVETNRTRELLKYAKLKSKPITIPKTEHRKLSYDKTLVTPIEWSPPRHIQSPVRETKQCVQIVQVGKMGLSKQTKYRLC
ncbi:hypothetical protein TWF281_010305 [Arthrobotrys megalospora]